MIVYKLEFKKTVVRKYGPYKGNLLHSWLIKEKDEGKLLALKDYRWLRFDEFKQPMVFTMFYGPNSFRKNLEYHKLYDQLANEIMFEYFARPGHEWVRKYKPSLHLIKWDNYEWNFKWDITEV